MRHILRTWMVALLFAVSAGGSLVSIATPQVAVAAPNCVGGSYFLTIPAWYNGLTEEVRGNCNIKQPESGEAGLSKFIWKIVLNIIEMMLHLIGYVTIGFIIFGGFKYMLSAGSPDGLSKAKTTIMNAVIGLILSIMSIAIVKLVSGAL